jgi:hypothetical protein
MVSRTRDGMSGLWGLDCVDRRNFRCRRKLLTIVSMSGSGICGRLLLGQRGLALPREKLVVQRMEYSLESY